MATQDQLNALIADIASDINGFIGASVVDVESGLPLASHSVRPDFDLDVASAYNSEMVKNKRKTIDALRLEATLEDMLLTLDTQLHLIKMIEAIPSSTSQPTVRRRTSPSSARRGTATWRP